MLASEASRADPLISKGLTPITFQLRWHHQFQFAGYYAAVEKGFYRDAGFDVTLVAGSPDHFPIQEVLAGRAQYAVGNSEVLLARLRGEPLVALSAIFQYSPSVLVTLKTSGIDSPKDLIGKRVMTMRDDADADFFAMLRAENVDIGHVQVSHSSFNIQDLVADKVDAFNSYLTNEPFYLEERGIKYNIISPRDYAVDFYSDIVFTSQKEVLNHPDRVERFRQATLQGWKYALAHPEEIIQLIHTKYNPDKTLNHLRFEALAAQSLILPDVVEVGYINRQRLESMAAIMIDEGMADSAERLDGFVFVYKEEVSSVVYYLLIAIFVFFVIALLVAFSLALFNRRLQAEAGERLAIEEKLKHLANTDYLTQLYNRRAFMKIFSEEVARARRYGDVFSVLLIDLDYFKVINDRYGHDAGDITLLSVADLLRKENRESDVCGRFGGEEFILLLPHTQLLAAEKYANRLCQHIRDNTVMTAEGDVIGVTASIGVAQWLPEDSDESTIKRADIALYQAKNEGRDRVVAWEQKH